MKTEEQVREEKFNQIWALAQSTNAKNKRDSFIRGLKYGFRAEALPFKWKYIPRWGIAWAGSNHGLERAILDIPKFSIPWALSLCAGAGVGQAFPALFDLSSKVAGDTGAKIGQAGSILVGEASALSLSSLVAKFFASKGVGWFGSHISRFSGAVGAWFVKTFHFASQPERRTTLGETIALSQSIQRCIGELVSGDALLIIDRELVKMRDAHDKALKVAQELEKVIEQAKSSEVLEDTFIQQLEDTLHATTEAVYYAEKVSILVNCLISSLSVLQNALDMYEAHVDLIFEKLKGHIIERFTLVEH